jgi:hypothetical protein
MLIYWRVNDINQENMGGTIYCLTSNGYNGYELTLYTNLSGDMRIDGGRGIFQQDMFEYRTVLLLAQMMILSIFFFHSTHDQTS